MTGRLLLFNLNCILATTIDARSPLFLPPATERKQGNNSACLSHALDLYNTSDLCLVRILSCLEPTPISHHSHLSQCLHRRAPLTLLTELVVFETHLSLVKSPSQRNGTNCATACIARPPSSSMSNSWPTSCLPRRYQPRPRGYRLCRNGFGLHLPRRNAPPQSRRAPLDRPRQRRGNHSSTPSRIVKNRKANGRCTP